MKKILSTLLLLCISILALTGCSGPKLDAAETVSAFYCLYVLGDSSQILELGLTEEDAASLLNSYDEALMTTLRNNITASGLTIEDSVIAEIVAARKDALKAMTGSTTLISAEKDTAVVALNTTYFNEKELDERAANDAIESIDALDSTDYEELLAAASEAYAQNLIKEYRSVAASEDTKEITVECKLTDNIWLPSDMAGFGEELGLVISGQK